MERDTTQDAASPHCTLWEWLSTLFLASLEHLSLFPLGGFLWGDKTPNSFHSFTPQKLLVYSCGRIVLLVHYLVFQHEDLLNGVYFFALWTVKTWKPSSLLSKDVCPYNLYQYKEGFKQLRNAELSSWCTRNSKKPNKRKKPSHIFCCYLNGSNRPSVSETAHVFLDLVMNWPQHCRQHSSAKISVFIHETGKRDVSTQCFRSQTGTLWLQIGTAMSLSFCFITT